jgi:hypothetical protein
MLSFQTIAGNLALQSDEISPFGRNNGTCPVHFAKGAQVSCFDLVLQNHLQRILPVFKSAWMLVVCMCQLCRT